MTTELKTKLEDKLNNRIGMKVTTLNDMNIGTITGYVVSTDFKENPIVQYMVAYGEGKNARLFLTKETNCVLMKEPNK